MYKDDQQSFSTVEPSPSGAGAFAQRASDSAGVADATGRARLSPGAGGIVSRSVEPNYPLLAKQMKIEGTVVLDALIGRGGNSQHLQVLSGSTILFAAAREAVQRWRFRPYLQSGQAVETEGRITVAAYLHWCLEWEVLTHLHACRDCLPDADAIHVARVHFT